MKPPLCPAVLLLFILQSHAAIIEQVDVAPVWSAHPVGFAFLTLEPQNIQLACYYDSARKMTVAKRLLSSKTWQYKALPTTTGWDGHNYIAMTVDDSGYIHISGNMHAVPLIYFRSLKPLSIDSMVSPGMVGNRESKVTYPVFIRGPKRELFFQYRDGGSGSGTTLWNQYDLQQKKWSRVTDSGLFNGEGVVNAYPSDPLLGPDGYFHVLWMWRETPVANTNHDLSHMKSSDLYKWETMSGTKLTLPVKRSTPGVVVDPVQSGNGLINMGFGIGWDSRKRPVIAYHKYDANGISQRWNTRWETDRWVVHQTSGWTTYKWPLDLTASLPNLVHASPVSIDGQGRLIQNYYHVNYGSRMWVLDETTLKPVLDTLPPPASPDIAAISKVESTFPGMGVRWLQSGDYILRWETLGGNNDKPRTPPLPDPSMLRVYKLSAQTGLMGHDKAGGGGKTVTSHFSAGALRFDIPETAFPGHAAVYSLTGKIIRDFGPAGGNRIVWGPPGRGCYLFRYISTGHSFSRKVLVP